MPRTARLRRAAIAILWSALALPAAGRAQEVTLRDGGEIVAEGELLGYDGRYYRLLGHHGEVTLDGRSLACDGAACPGADWIESLRISGEAAILEGLLPHLLETYALRRDLELDITEADDRRIYRFLRDGPPLGRLVLYPTTSAESLADIVADAADLAVTLRPPAPLETDLAEQAGRGDLTAPGRSAILALDAVVPVVAVSNPVGALGSADLGAILSGAIRDWSALGAPAGPIRVHLPAPRSGFGEAIASRLPVAGARATLHHDPEAIVAAVAADPAAFGLALLSSTGEVRPLRLTGPCGAEAAAIPFAVKAGDYPLSLPVFLYAPARHFGAFARDVVDYLTSPVAQPVIVRTGLTDQFPEAIAFGAQGERLGRGLLAADGLSDLATLKRMVGDLGDAQRLSMSFRFEEGSTALDAQSAANVALLAEATRRGIFEERELVFAGFSDGRGPAATNITLSRQRALVVREALAARIGEAEVTLSAGAYGEALPMACDGTAGGRRINRRVEVWLR